MTHKGVSLNKTLTFYRTATVNNHVKWLFDVTIFIFICLYINILILIPFMTLFTIYIFVIN